MQTVALRDGTHVNIENVPPGTDYWHPECNPPEGYYETDETDPCPHCGAPAGEPCQPMPRPTHAAAVVAVSVMLAADGHTPNWPPFLVAAGAFNTGGSTWHFTDGSRVTLGDDGPIEYIGG